MHKKVEFMNHKQNTMSDKVLGMYMDILIGTEELKSRYGDTASSSCLWRDTSNREYEAIPQTSSQCETL